MFYDYDKAVTRREALELLFSRWPAAHEIEKLPLSAAVGSVTAEDLFSSNTLPPYRVSAFDDFAVRSEDFENGMPDTSCWKRGVQYVPADTGDDFPDGYDTVIAVEDVSFDERGRFMLNDGFKFTKGEAVRAAGSVLKPGDLLVRKNTCVTPEIQAVLAIGGVSFVPVLKKPKVAFLPTGSELIPAGTPPERGQNIDSNSLMVSSMLEEWGAEPICFPITKDDRVLLSQRLDEALNMADIVVVNGGTSKGTEDFNSHMIEERASFFRHGVKAVPGRPIGMAIINGKPVLNIPGPVLAAWLAMDWLVRGLLCHYYGTPAPKRQTVTGILTSDIKKGAGFEMLCRVHIKRNGDGYLISPVPRSADMAFALREGNGLLTLPIGFEGLLKGESVMAELLTGEENIV